MNKVINLKSLKLKNFKGIKDLEIDFSKATNIYGENGVGKTTVFDAVTWLLFDKDSNDRKEFKIKTLDNGGEPIHGLEHTVEGTLEIDGSTITLSKTYKEKWTKKRGEASKTLTGHETNYVVDEVPVNKSEYVWQIQQFIDEKLFKLLTNPLYFNTNLKWQDRREMLLEVIGNISDEKVIESNTNLSILTSLLGGKDVETFKKSVAAKKKKLNESIKAIPIRIDELNNSIEKDIDIDSINKEIETLENKVLDIDSCIADMAKADDEKLKLQENIFSIKSKIKDLENEAKLESEKPLSEMKIKSIKLKAEIENNSQLIMVEKNKSSRSEKQIKELEEEILALREKWNEINIEELDIQVDKEFICPTCKRELDPTDIEQKKLELLENFNKDKSTRLSKISAEGKRKRAAADELNKEIELMIEKIDTLNQRNSILSEEVLKTEKAIEEFVPGVSIDFKNRIQVLEKELSSLESSKVESSREEELEAYKVQKTEINMQIYELKKNSLINEQNQKTKIRIAELMDEERELSGQIADLEGQEYACEEFIITKVNMLEGSINNKFKFVKFKLFNVLVNGALEECCETLIDGVPFQDANTASKINAGIDIINTLSEHFEVQAPIFIDNRESVNKLIECKSQLVNLIVSNDAELKIESEE